MALLEGNLSITGELSAGVIKGLRQESLILGDGSTRVFDVTHTLGVKLVLPTLYDSGGRIVYTEIRCVSETVVRVVFFSAPDVGESFSLVLRR